MDISLYNKIKQKITYLYFDKCVKKESSRISIGNSLLEHFELGMSNRDEHMDINFRGNAYIKIGFR